MNKSELKTGMYVEDRLEHKIRVIGKYFVTDDLEMRGFDKYREDLTYALNDKDEDIMKVLDENYNLLWERQEVDWSKIPKDTKVLVKNHNDNYWNKEYFNSYSGGKYYTYMDGKTAWSNNSGTLLCWDECKLAEEPPKPRKEMTLKGIDEAFRKFCRNQRKYGCASGCLQCTYNGSPCKMAWLLDNYNVTEK